MQSKTKASVGHRYGRLRMLEILKNQRCVCVCDCGRLCYPPPWNVIGGKQKTCGEHGKDYEFIHAHVPEVVLTQDEIDFILNNPKII